MSDPGTPTEPTALSRVWLFATLLLIMVTVAVTYAPAADGPFFFDDFDSIITNPHVRVIWPLDEAMSAPRNSAFVSRPLVSLSASLNYAIFGDSPAGFRWVNIVLHGLAACSLFLATTCLLKLTRLRDSALPAAAAIALLWAAHWINIDSVAYITQRSKVMLGLFAFLTVFAAARSWTSDSPKVWQLFAATACVFGMMSKESMVGVPIVVLLIDRQLMSGSFLAALKRHRGLYIGLAASWLVLVALMISSPRSNSVGSHLGISSWEYLLTQSEVIVHYLTTMIVYRPMLVHHEWPIANGLGEVIGHVAIMLGLLAGTIYLLWRKHWLGVVGAVVFIMLGPTSSVVPMTTELVAERRMYMPSAALITAVVVGSSLLLRRIRIDAGQRLVLAVIATLGFTVTVSIVTRHRLAIFQSESTIWLTVLERYPDSWMANHNLAVSYRREQQLDASFRSLVRAQELEGPDETLSSSMLIDELVNRRRIDEAEAIFDEAVRRRPDSAKLRMYLGKIRLAQNRVDEAEAVLLKVEPELGDDPDYLSLRTALAWNRGRLDEALRFQREATQMRYLPDPNDAFREGLLLAQMGNRREAVTMMDRALSLDPNHVAAAQLKQQLLQDLAQPKLSRPAP